METSLFYLMKHLKTSFSYHRISSAKAKSRMILQTTDQQWSLEDLQAVLCFRSSWLKWGKRTIAGSSWFHSNTRTLIHTSLSKVETSSKSSTPKSEDTSASMELSRASRMDRFDLFENTEETTTMKRRTPADSSKSKPTDEMSMADLSNGEMAIVLETMKMLTCLDLIQRILQLMRS